VKRYGGKECIISVSPPKSCGSLIKTGVHLNWYGYVVDQASAVALREHILVALSKAKSSIDWNEIIDAAVYGDLHRKTKGSGFRMPWSYKKAKHDLCDGRGCDACHGGKIDQLSYLPVFRYTTEPLSTIIRIDSTPDVEILKASTIRTDAPQNTFVEPPSMAIREGTFTSDEIKDEIQNEVVRVRIEQFVQNNMEGQGGSYITKLFKFKTHT